MIITIAKSAPEEAVNKLLRQIERLGVKPQVIEGEIVNVYGLVGDTSKLYERDILANELISSVQRVQAPYKLTNRAFHPEDTVVDVAGVKVGGNEKVAIIGGPCSVETLDGVCEIAEEVKEAGATMLRGGAYKPRTSPYAFQGLGYEGIVDLVEARKRTGLPIVSEIMSVDKLDEFAENVDLIQVGARNMQNFDLLKALGKVNKPVLLKRGMSATIEEWIMSAEYIVASGNPNVIMCERGIRTFEKMTRNTLDLSVVPLIHEKTHLPIVIDPSHATGDWKLVEPMALAAVAAGADGLIIEVHNRPDDAWCDGAQSLKPERFENMIKKARVVANAVGRDI